MNIQNFIDKLTDTIIRNKENEYKEKYFVGYNNAIRDVIEILEDELLKENPDILQVGINQMNRESRQLNKDEVRLNSFNKKQFKLF